MKLSLRTGAAVLICPLIFYAMQIAFGGPACFDCSIEVGFPLHYLHTGGFAGGDRTLWFGLFVDLGIAFGVSCCTVYGFSRLKKSK